MASCLAMEERRNFDCMTYVTSVERFFLDILDNKFTLEEIQKIACMHRERLYGRVQQTSLTEHPNTEGSREGQEHPDLVVKML